jgi:hypothetical protein
MRVHFLPAEQKLRNDKAIEKIRHIGYVAFVLLMLTIALGTKLYIWPPRMQSGPRVVTQDGRTVDAIVLAPDLVLCAAKASDSARFFALGESLGARRLDSTALPDGTEITLFRLENQTSVAPVTIVVIELGDGLVSTAGGQEWHGVAREKLTNGYSVEPDLGLVSGTPVYRADDKSALAGFVVRSDSSSVVISAKDVLDHFPDLRMGH